ncbi:MAG TPA: CoA transferase, partial [Sphaerochaeta sp.]|nr:CoA transferase [Sphaerochaeta sp.]
VFQPMTRGAMARPPQILADTGIAWSGGVPGGKVGARPWDYSPTFVSLYRNKKSFTVDLRRPEGLNILKRLVAESDVVYENNATGTMEGLGITYDWLKAANRVEDSSAWPKVCPRFNAFRIPFVSVGSRSM